MIKEKIKNLYTKKFFRFAVIPFVLFSLWVGLTFLYIITFDTSLSVLSYIHGKQSFNKVQYSKLLAGDKISGEFKAQENNLGIVSVKFQTFIRPPYKYEDTIVFRIKEKGGINWFSENKYRNGLMYDVQPFLFGFPKILDSKGKTYYFELESLNGNENNSIALSNKSQILFSKYQVSKALLLHDNKELIIFGTKKFVSAMLTTDVRFSLFIYLLPFLFYLFWISVFKKYAIDPFVGRINKAIVSWNKKHPLKFSIPLLKSFRHILTYNLDWIIIFVVLIDVFIVQLTNDIVYLVIVGLWIATIRAYKLNSKHTFILALSLLLLPPFFLFFKDTATAEKATIWAFMFLVAGTIQALMELKSEKSD